MRVIVYGALFWGAPICGNPHNGPKNYQSHAEVYLKYRILELYSEDGTRICWKFFRPDQHLSAGFCKAPSSRHGHGIHGAGFQP